ncbi:MAG: stage II sporulation protein P [Bacillota bacterium]|nr:stage II sporulation protein P [Bacillota bacterium]
MAALFLCLGLLLAVWWTGGAGEGWRRAASFLYHSSVQLRRWSEAVVVPATVFYLRSDREAPRRVVQEAVAALAQWSSGSSQQEEVRAWTRGLLKTLTCFDLGDPRTFFYTGWPGFTREEELMAEMSLAGEGGSTSVPAEAPGEAPGMEGEVAGQPPEAETSPASPGARVTPLEREVATPRSSWGYQPLVAIYHTHSSETYHGPGVHRDPRQYFEGDYAWGRADGMISVGGEVAKRLSEVHRIPVVHVRRVHDYPVFRHAYINSRRSLREVLEKYPSLVLVLDLHRDGLEEPSQEAITATVGGRHAARISIIVGRGRPGFSNPHWQDNLALARRLQARMEEMYPGLYRGTIVREWPFNQDLHRGALLLEIGDHYNTKEEALHSARLLADVLAAVVKELVEERTPPLVRRGLR